MDGHVAPVREIFQSVLRQTENTGLRVLQSGTLFFGFSIQAGVTPLLVRWNQLGIQFFRGELLTAKDFAVAFPPPPGS